jgi:hypothetical protein
MSAFRVLYAVDGNHPGDERAVSRVGGARESITVVMSSAK